MSLSEKTIERMKTLTELHGAPGFEDLVRKYMREELEQLSDEVIQDGLGGIFAVKRSKKENAPKVMVAGHMDEVGFMVTQITKQGLLKFQPLGGWPTDVLLAQRFKVRTSENKEITGVIGSVPVHFRKGDTSKTEIKDMLLDVGANSKEEVEEMGIQVGDSMVPAVNFEVLENPKKILAKAWDNRYGCLIAIETLEALKDVELDCDLYIGATVQEEVGLRGAKTAANMIEPDVAFAVDCSPANDLTGSDQDIGKLGEGTLVRIIDRTMILSKPMRDYLLETAKTHDIKHQYFQSPGGTDAGSIHLSGNGVVSAVVGVVARYIHTSHSVLNTDDYLAAKSMLEQLIRGINEDKLKELRG